MYSDYGQGLIPTQQITYKLGAEDFVTAVRKPIPLMDSATQLAAISKTEVSLT